MQEEFAKCKHSRSNNNNKKKELQRTENWEVITESTESPSEDDNITEVNHTLNQSRRPKYYK